MSVWKQDYTSLFISVKFLGTYWEFWSEYRIFGDDSSVFFQETKEKYKTKFGKRPFKIRVNYPNTSYQIQ